MRNLRTLMTVAVSTWVALTLAAWPAHAATSREVAVKVSGGHVTDSRDHGRPVVLIASALGVPSEVFREAFSHVSPAPGGIEPDPAQVSRNKSALMSALGPYGVTNETLDRVSNYYRYVGSAGQLWPTRSATIRAVVTNGTLTKVTVVEGGAGYTSKPGLRIPGFPKAKVTVTLGFSRDFATNGRLIQATLAR